MTCLYGVVFCVSTAHILCLFYLLGYLLFFLPTCGQFQYSEFRPSVVCVLCRYLLLGRGPSFRYVYSVLCCWEDFNFNAGECFPVVDVELTFSHILFQKSSPCSCHKDGLLCFLLVVFCFCSSHWACNVFVWMLLGAALISPCPLRDPPRPRIFSMGSTSPSLIAKAGYTVGEGAVLMAPQNDLDSTST